MNYLLVAITLFPTVLFAGGLSPTEIEGVVVVTVKTEKIPWEIMIENRGSEKIEYEQKTKGPYGLTIELWSGGKGFRIYPEGMWDYELIDGFYVPEWRSIDPGAKATFTIDPDRISGSKEAVEQWGWERKAGGSRRMRIVFGTYSSRLMDIPKKG